MARKTTKKTGKSRGKTPNARPRLGLVRLTWRAGLSVFLAMGLAVLAYRVVSPPTTPYIMSEAIRLDGVQRSWVSVDDVAPVMLRSLVAAEDANFCLHWGFDMRQLRAAIAQGGERGASTLTQQTVKNVWLWHGRSWVRKAVEAVMTPMVEMVWSKRRILEVYLNVAEFDEGVFGIEAAAEHHFGVRAADLSARQAALLAAVLPNPKERQAVGPSAFVDRRARSIADGAATIKADGRADCFED